MAGSISEYGSSYPGELIFVARRSGHPAARIATAITFRSEVSALTVG
jgi:hypothetical protein